MRWQALLWIVSVAWFFTFLSVLWWARERRREREAFYRFELSKRLAEKGDCPLTEIEALDLRLRERDQAARRPELRTLALVLLCGGLGALVALRFPIKEEALLGWVPIGIGLALLVELALSRRRSP